MNSNQDCRHWCYSAADLSRLQAPALTLAVCKLHEDLQTRAGLQGADQQQQHALNGTVDAGSQGCTLLYSTLPLAYIV